MLDVELHKFWTGRETPHYFHPAVCNTANGDLIMTMQLHSGVSDQYGDPEFALSQDEGATWSEPKTIESLRTKNISDSILEGVADVRPFYHPQTKSVIAIGCNSYYGNNKNITSDEDFDREKHKQIPVYAIYKSDGTWSQRRDLLPKSFLKDSLNWRVACTQLVVLDDGDLIIPLYLDKKDDAEDSSYFVVCTVRCSFDGEDIIIKEVGECVCPREEDGYFVEPSVIKFNDKFYMTIRVNDKACCAESTDGLNWVNLKSWSWDDGEILDTENTQQHWLALGDKLYLVYTKKSKEQGNEEVMRYRAPLFTSEVDPAKCCLIRQSEQVALPLVWSDEAPGLLGNFHVFNASKTEAIISDAPIWFKIVWGQKREDDYIDDVRTDVWVAKIKTV